MIFNKNPSTGRRANKLPTAPTKSRSYAYFSKRAPRSDQVRRTNGAVDTTSPKASLFWNHLLSLVLILAILVILVDFLWLDTNPKIIIQNGNSTPAIKQSSSHYQAVAHQILAGSLLDQNKLTINVFAISSEMEKKFPQLSNVTLTLPVTGHQVDIYIQPSKASVLLDTGSNVFILDSGGVIIDQETSSNINSVRALDLPLVNDINLIAKVDQQILSSNDVSFILYVDEELQLQHIPISTMSLPVASRELDVSINSQPYFVKFNLQGDPKEQVGTYLALKQYLSQNKIIPSQYVDVRVGGRAYYK